MVLSRAKIQSLFLADADRAKQRKENEKEEYYQNKGTGFTPEKALLGAGVGFLTGGPVGAVAGAVSGSQQKGLAQAGLSGYSAGSGLSSLAGGSKDIGTQLGTLADPKNLYKSTEYIKGVVSGDTTKAASELGKMDYDEAQQKAKAKTKEEAEVKEFERKKELAQTKANEEEANKKANDAKTKANEEAKKILLALKNKINRQVSEIDTYDNNAVSEYIRKTNYRIDNTANEDMKKILLDSIDKVRKISGI